MVLKKAPTLTVRLPPRLVLPGKNYRSDASIAQKIPVFFLLSISLDGGPWEVILWRKAPFWKKTRKRKSNRGKFKVDSTNSSFSRNWTSKLLISGTFRVRRSFKAGSLQPDTTNYPSLASFYSSATASRLIPVSNCSGESSSDSESEGEDPVKCKLCEGTKKKNKESVPEVLLTCAACKNACKRFKLINFWVLYFWPVKIYFKLARKS